MGRRVVVLVALAAILVLSPLSPSGAQVATGSEAVTADKTGWWNSLQGIESGTPAAPLGGVTPGVPQQATGVPPGDFASALRLGEVDKVSAVGITVDALPGATVEEFTMTLTESADPAASNSGSAVAAITACPIVAFWVEAENARFNGRPEANCELASAPGERDEEGRWKFDLKAYGQELLSPTSTLGQHGVLLMPVGGPPATFQVTWAGLASETPPQFTFRATGGSEPEDPFAVGGQSFDSGGDFGGTTTFGDDIRTDSFGSGTGGDFATGQATVPEPPAEPAPVEETQPTAAGRSVGEQVGNIMGNIPLIAVLGFLGLLALLVVAGLALGRPMTAEAAVTRRGGVTRALSARRATRTHTLEAT
ncbi:MAG: hypothetical protein KY395_00825 [Actinobacteria bacterium]|nr:hypothetical protein [Actinomycetota bacterium]